MGPVGVSRCTVLVLGPVLLTPISFPSCSVCPPGRTSFTFGLRRASLPSRRSWDQSIRCCVRIRFSISMGFLSGGGGAPRCLVGLRGAPGGWCWSVALAVFGGLRVGAVGAPARVGAQVYVVVGCAGPGAGAVGVGVHPTGGHHGSGAHSRLLCSIRSCRSAAIWARTRLVGMVMRPCWWHQTTCPASRRWMVTGCSAVLVVVMVVPFWWWLVSGLGWGGQDQQGHGQARHCDQCGHTQQRCHCALPCWLRRLARRCCMRPSRFICKMARTMDETRAETSMSLVCWCVGSWPVRAMARSPSMG